MLEPFLMLARSSVSFFYLFGAVANAWRIGDDAKGANLFKVTIFSFSRSGFSWMMPDSECRRDARNAILWARARVIRLAPIFTGCLVARPAKWKVSRIRIQTRPKALYGRRILW